MTIEEARKILSKDGEKMTDEQILEYINTANILSDIFLDMWFKITPEERKRYGNKKNNTTAILRK